MTAAMTRRRVLGGAAVLAWPAAARAADAASLPAQPSLLVAGPASSPVGRWAEVIAAPLAQGLLSTEPLDRDNVGGPDGVTGVNRFQALTSPDGATALLLPGAALLAWLAGDARVRFDAGTWAPLWGGCTSAIVATRQPIAPGRRMRLPIGAVAGPELAALLALFLIGVDVVPVRAAVPDVRDVDAVLLRGPVSPAALAQEGWRPAFRLGGAHEFADASLPSASELFRPGVGDPALVSAYQAVATAASLQVALVAPAVAPAAVLAWWRRGCEGMADASIVRDAAAAIGMQQDGSGAIASQLATVALDTAAMLAFRSLLADRFGWLPG